ncbi:DUF4179 domain-containing protein [Saccharibacillus sp. CPCC 101409]|uniref:DUF4179 domain-containing protein n=1 Tax=Saccharibacillus sp. CPCC 101409 TaxID=3058041 RepID=UPI00267216E3|nr:DUF4179 domain-containing protein [Saccharibacillus sp. CPCC 101409]MDO3409811.1 DUF4179 domain-containing protein [Saccharibacillus sp. CPCC 101409]
MKRQNIDRLAGLRETGAAQIPSAVERRLEETFRMIREGEADAHKPTGPEAAAYARRAAKRGRFSRLRRTAAIAAASVLLAGAGLTGLGFASPSFAQAMQNVPIIGGIFSLYGDHGLKAAEEQGLVQPSSLTATVGGMTVGVRNVIYDGTRIALEVYREGDGALYNGGDLNHPKRGMLDGVQASYGSQTLLPSYRAAGDGTVMVVMDRPLDESLPDKFELSLVLNIEGADRPFELEVPVESNAAKTVIEEPEVPKELVERGVVVDRIILTPVTTQVLFHHRPKAEDTEGTFVNADDFELFDIIRDDLGREYESLSGAGEPDLETGSKQFYTFEPIDSQAKELTLGFAMPGEQNGKPYTYIEMDVPLPK